MIARLITCFFTIGSAVHALSFLLMGAGVRLYGPTYPAWRHVAMTIADGAIAWIGWRRERWLVFVVPVWVAEQFTVNGFQVEAVVVAAAWIVLVWERVRRPT